MAAVPLGQPLQSCLPAVLGLLFRNLSDLQTGKVSPRYLVISQALSKPVTEYHLPSPATRAVMQLEAAGKERRPGQRVKFIYIYGEPGVHAWDLPQPVDIRTIDVGRYTTLMVRAAAAVLQPLDVKENELFNWLMGYGYQSRFHLNPIGNVLGLDSSEKKIQGSGSCFTCPQASLSYRFVSERLIVWQKDLNLGVVITATP